MSVCVFSKVMGKRLIPIRTSSEERERHRSDARTQVVSISRELVDVHVSPGLSVTTSLDPEPQVGLDTFINACLMDFYLYMHGHAASCVYSFATVISCI